MLSVSNLSCGYGSGDVVKEVTFSLAESEILCLSGPNGCGKTTLLRAVCGLLPYTGTVRVMGDDIGKMKRGDIARKIALFSQTSSVYFPYSVYETVLMGRYLHLKKGFFPTFTREDRDVAEACLARVGMLDCGNRNITELSGGQLQRTMLARVFAQQPSIILLDEPTNHLDIRHQIETIEYIREWAMEEKRAVLAVFHDINLTMTVADSVILMDDGRIAQQGSAREVLGGSKIAEVYGVDVGSYMRKTLSLWQQDTKA